MGLLRKRDIGENMEICFLLVDFGVLFDTSWNIIRMNQVGYRDGMPVVWFRVIWKSSDFFIDFSSTNSASA